MEYALVAVFAAKTLNLLLRSVAQMQCASFFPLWDSVATHAIHLPEISIAGQS
jgi:hypothetical protein